MFLILICPGGLLKAQGDFGIIAGISNYQGDLASTNNVNGFKAKIGPVFGLHAGYELSPRFQLRGDLLYTRLSGADSLNAKEITKSRNLDFFSPIIQLAGGCDLNLFRFSIKDGKGFTLYATAGGSLFYMNPKTNYNGQKVALHPLGTEGQYLSDYPDQKPYSLFQPTLQFGGGMKILTSSKLIIALEAMLSYTFTDYIDDVSTIYISYPELLEKAGSLTAALANRQGEYFNSEPAIVPTGAARGNSQSNDFFGTIAMRVSVPVDISSQKFKVRHKNAKTIHCPKF